MSGMEALKIVEAEDIGALMRRLAPTLLALPATTVHVRTPPQTLPREGLPSRA